MADSPWSAYGQETYSAEGLAVVKRENYGYETEDKIEKELESIPGAIDKITDQEWVNVYNVEEFSFDADPDFPEREWILSGKIYTVVHGGEVRYIVQLDEYISTFTYYPGNGYFKKTKANTQEMYVDTTKYSALAYNINDNNYFKLRDVTDVFDCRVEWDNKNQLIKVYTSLPAYADPNEPVG